MRILHLAYEDPRQPGSGGGAIRTREINRRLSERHEITCLVTGYPGARERTEDGIRWVPIGTRSGTKVDRLAYFAALPRGVAKHHHDLLVEDFGAPFSVGFSPKLTRKPVVASVQWLFASEMRSKYGLPFDWVERLGLPLYSDFIAVSSWLADVIRQRRSDAVVETIANGVEGVAFSTPPMPPEHLLFVGRLDVEQKGGDLLIEIMDRVSGLLGSRTPRLVILGDGPGRKLMEQDVARRRLSHLVEFRGRVEGPGKYRAMAGSFALLMPSRFETFGMVAVEGQAAGAPVVAFDVGPLREVTGGSARLVPAFDVDLFAREVADLVTDSSLADQARDLGRTWARQYDWDQLALRQEAHYLRAVARIEGQPLATAR